MRSILFGPLVRLVPVGLVFVAIQRVVCARYTIDTVVVQVVLALVVAAGATGGSERGALAGFVLGMMYDLGVGTPLGISALAYGVAGLVAGYVLSITPDPQWWLASLFCFVGAAVGEAAQPAALMLTGEDGLINVHLIEIVLIVAAAATVMSPLLLPLGRWCMAVKRPKWKAIPE